MRLTEIAGNNAGRHWVKPRTTFIRFVFAGLLLLLASCGGPSSMQPIFHPEGNPASLSDWNVLLLDDQQLKLAERVVAYDLNTPLFSDYAHKLRTVWVPPGTSAKYNDTDTFDFPVGTILSKTFYYPVSTAGGSVVQKAKDTTAQRVTSDFYLKDVKLIETRLLVHREEGWVALPYVWNDEQSEAILKRAGDIKNLELASDSGSVATFSYVVPNANQCAGCHATNATTRKLEPIGPKARHLNKDYPYAEGELNQLVHWQDLGLLGQNVDLVNASQNALWGDGQASLNEQARAYLDINCAHCHNEVGPADTSGLHLEASTSLGVHLGKCKLPIAAGTGTGGRKFDIVPGQADKSIFVFRMNSTDPAVMMPELGRSLAHAEGVELIRRWIGDMAGACE